MPTPLDIARRRLAAATTDRQRAGCALALALLSIPAASLSAPDVHRRLGSGNEAGGLDAPLPRSVSELIQRYVWGTGSILLGDAIWLSLVDRPLRPFEVIAGLCVITAASGSVVVLRYISDHLTRVAKKEPLYQDQVEKLERTRE